MASYYILIEEKASKYRLKVSVLKGKVLPFTDLEHICSIVREMRNEARKGLPFGSKSQSGPEDRFKVELFKPKRKKVKKKRHGTLRRTTSSTNVPTSDGSTPSSLNDEVATFLSS